MFDRLAASAVSSEMLGTLNGDRVAYIKAVRSEQVGFLSADAPLLEPGHRVYVLHGADGSPLLLAATHESALAGAARHDIETVSVH